MPRPANRSTIAWMMLRVACWAVVLAPAGCVARLPPGERPGGIGLLLGYYGLVATFALAYRGFRNPFG